MPERAQKYIVVLVEEARNFSLFKMKDLDSTQTFPK